MGHKVIAGRETPRPGRPPGPARPVVDRFYEKVDSSQYGPAGCHVWRGALGADGGGRFRVGGRHGRTVLAYRLAWELHAGCSIPEGMEVRHRCDARECVNPAHLELGTHLQNMQDKQRRGRLRTIHTGPLPPRPLPSRAGWTGPSAAQRFRSKVSAPNENGCREWQGTLVQGYGHISVDGRPRKAHRFAWELANGPIPQGLVVRHKCDNKWCVAVEHLELGTHQDNSDDKYRRGRGSAPRGETHGQARLTSNDVAAIRTRAWADESTLDLANEFGISRSHIESLAAGKSRPHDGWPAGTNRDDAAGLWATAVRAKRRAPRPGAAKLSDAQVALVCERAAKGESYRALAVEFNVSPSHISAIVRGVKRFHDGLPNRLPPDRTDHRQKLSEAEVHVILARFHAGETRKQITADFGISMSYLYMLARGKKRRGVECQDPR